MTAIIDSYPDTCATSEIHAKQHELCIAANPRV